MRKTLCTLILLLLWIPTWAQSKDGKSKETAYEYDWAEGAFQIGSSDSVWYHIDLSPIHALEDPKLIIQLVNQTGDSLHVGMSIEAPELGQKESRAYAIAPNGNKTWSQEAGMLKAMNVHEIYLALKADKNVKLLAIADETDDIDEACMNAKPVTTVDQTVNAKSEQWYSLDLNGMTENQVYVLHYKNNTSIKATVNRSLSPNCPVSSPSVKKLSIARNETYTDTLSRAMLYLMGKDAYVQLYSSQKLQIHGEVYTISTSTEEIDGCPVLDQPEETWEPLTGAGTSQHFRVPLRSLYRQRRQPQIKFSNESNATDATVTIDIVIDGKCPSSLYTTHTVTIPAGEIGSLDISRDMVMAIDSNTVEYIYARITTQQLNMQAMWRMKHLHEGDACKSSTPFNWADGHYQDAETSIWYAIPIKEAKDEKQDIITTLENRGDEQATINGLVVFMCPNYSDGQDMTRTINAGQSVQKTLPYSSFGSMATDTLWISITTDQPIYFKAETQPTEKIDDHQCEQAVPFDWNNGHVQTAGDTAWYKVPLDTIRNAVKKGMLPYLTVYNRGNATGTFNSAVAYECPVTTAYNERTQSLGALSTYERLISTDMISQIDKSIDTVYVRIVGSQDVSFQIKMVTPDEGSSCTNAIPFNWVTGNDYTQGEETWYMLDLTAVQETTLDLAITLVNKSGEDGNVLGELATVCPCSTTEKKSYSMKAGASRTDTIAHATVESFGSTLWIKLSADINLHFEAKLIEPAPFDTILACADAKPLKYDSTYTISDTTWFYVLTNTVHHTPLVPKVTLKNGMTSQTINAELAYSCPVTATMMQNLSSFAAGQSKTKMLERSTAEALANKHDTIWVRLSGSVKDASFSFRVSLIDPNDGHDCAHAKYLLPDTTFIQKAGKTLWYYVDREALVEAEKTLQLIYHNIDTAEGETSLSIYADCESSPITIHSETIAAGDSIKDQLSTILMSGMNGQYLYLQLYTEREDSIEIKGIAPQPIDSIKACEQAIALMPNTEYTIAAGDTVWYSANLNDLRNNYAGNGLVTMINNSSEELHIIGSMSWVCPITTALNEQNYTIPAGEDYIEELSREALEKMAQDIVYIRLIADQNMTWSLEMTLDRGDDCGHGIIFDWENGNVHPANEYLWYTVAIDSARIDGYDLRLNIANLSDTTTSVTCAIRTDCRSNPLQTISYKFGPGETKHKDIDLDLIKYSGQWPQATWSLYYYSSEVTKIWVDTIEQAADKLYYDTLHYTLCDGAEFIDTIAKPAVSHYIDSYDRTTLEWNDTVQVREGTYLIDSIFTIQIRPIVAPDTASFAPTVLPIFRQGMKIFTDSASAQLKRYYETTPNAHKGDSVLPIVAINWEIAETELRGQDIHEAYPDPLSKTDALITDIRCVITLEEGCEDKTTIYSQTFNVAPVKWRTDSTQALDTIVCVGTEYVAVDGQTYTINRDTTLRILRENITVKDTMKMDRNIDSLYIYQFATYKMPKMKQLSSLDVRTQPIAAIGEVIDNSKADQILSTNYSAAQPQGTAAIDTMLWQVQFGEGNDFIALDPDYVLQCEDTELAIRHAIVVAPCGDTLYSDTLKLSVTSLPIYVPIYNKDSARVICGEPIGIETIDKEIKDSIEASSIFAKTTVESIEWFFRLTEDSEWKNITGKDTMDSRIDNIDIRVVIQTTCGTVEDVFNSIVAPASAENVANYNNLKATQKYGNRLLMIHLNSIIEQIGDTIEASEVEWYQKRGELDHIEIDDDGFPYLVPDAPETSDTMVCKGQYYYSLSGQQLPGDYYALIVHQGIIEKGKCGVTMRTEILYYGGDPTPSPTRKVVEGGNVIIITEDEERYDTNGRKLY